jgi:hypothetical protein
MDTQLLGGFALGRSVEINAPEPVQTARETRRGPNRAVSFPAPGRCLTARKGGWYNPPALKAGR